MYRCTRRRFLHCSLKGAAGLSLLPLASCSSPPASETEAITDPPAEYPLIDVSGKTYRDVGRNLGEAAKTRIREYLSLSRDFPRCREFVKKDGKRLEKMLRPVRQHCPRILEELEGMAEAVGLPFLELFAYNCRSEISVLLRSAGCSTILLKENGRMIVAHNEDGDDLNVGRMFVARVKPPSGVRFISFIYPGLMPGNGPGFNDHGICQTTNYIEPREIHEGVPRYFVGRTVLEARNLDEAVALAACRNRAFSWHHNIMSRADGRILSVETYPGRHHVKEIDGVYVHTNHLIHPEMDGEPDIPYESSTRRLRVIRATMEKNGEPCTAGQMVDLLSLHEGKPYSPCRHPAGKIHGATLGTALFEGSDAAMTLYHGNPCCSIKKRYTL